MEDNFDESSFHGIFIKSAEQFLHEYNSNFNFKCKNEIKQKWFDLLIGSSNFLKFFVLQL